MGQCINLAVHAAQAGQQQGAAAQIGGFADGRHIDVNALAGFGHAGQVGGNHDGGHVFEVDLAAAGGGFIVAQRVFLVHAHAVEQGFHALGGKRQVRAVARALQTHHQAVADELVATHGGHGGQVFDAVGVRQRERQHPQQGRQGQGEQEFSHGGGAFGL